VRIRKRLTSDVRRKDAPAAAQRKYEGKYERVEVRADEEMDVGGVGSGGYDFREGLRGIISKAVETGLDTLSPRFGVIEGDWGVMLGKKRKIQKKSI